MHIAGAQPNFVKVAPIIQEVAKHGREFEQILVHTGQHYDTNMSQIFFEELELPRPTINLEIGSGSHAAQTAQLMLRFEPILLKYKPDWVFVPGDVNSTLACALVASKLGVKIARVEAGLRSFDRTMSEEINRVLTDQIFELLLTPSPDGNENLLREGIAPERIHLVGNVMIDTLVRLLPKAQARWPQLQARLQLQRYLLVTLHRPANVDDPAALHEIMRTLDEISREIPVIFPLHLRTRWRMLNAGGATASGRLQLVEPVGYLDFLALQAHAALVLTDSGGVQEETTYLEVPWLTVRPNTESARSPSRTAPIDWCRRHVRRWWRKPVRWAWRLMCGWRDTNPSRSCIVTFRREILALYRTWPTNWCTRRSPTSSFNTCFWASQ
jgi:UDP-N-acetylglucosamine 2-epimerase (non-hydrolysing)